MRRSAKRGAAEVELGDAVAVAPRPARADLALDEHDELGVEAQDAVEALAAVGVGDLAGRLLGFGVGRQEDADEALAPDLAAGGALLGGVDDVGRLHVDGAVRQFALRALADRAQQRLAGERHEAQDDHRGARELVLVRAPELAVGLEDVQVRVGASRCPSLKPHRPPLAVARVTTQS